jgi:Methionine aminopeptidase
MVTAGNPDIYRDKNGWTYRVKDGGWAAHFEHTIAIFPDGARILTKIDEPESPNEDEFKN